MYSIHTMLKTRLNKYLLKITVLVYIVITSVFLLFQLESNYRSNLVAYGVESGRDSIVRHLIDSLEKNPCKVLQLEQEKQTINIISTSCITQSQISQ